MLIPKAFPNIPPVCWFESQNLLSGELTLWYTFLQSPPSVSKSWVEQSPHLNPPLSLQFVGLGFCSGQHAEMVCLPLKVKLYHCSMSPWSVAGSAWHISSSHPPNKQLLHLPIGPMLSICPVQDKLLLSPVPLNHCVCLFHLLGWASAINRVPPSTSLYEGPALL